MEILSSVDEACRLCLRGEGKISVFEDDTKTTTVTPENIYDCVSVKITKNDKLPKGICESCLESVKSWCSFKNNCDETQKKLQGWLISNNLEKNPEKDEACVACEKENIKSSSCNTYKIIDEDRSCKEAPDLLTDFPHEHCTELRPDGENSAGPDNMECSDSRLPNVDEPSLLTLPPPEPIDRLPNVVQSRSSSEELVCEAPSRAEGSSAPNSCVLDNKCNVNILDNSIQHEICGVSDSLICKYEVDSEKDTTSPMNDIILENNKVSSENSDCEINKCDESSAPHLESFSKKEENVEPTSEISCSSSTEHTALSQENVDSSKFVPDNGPSNVEHSVIDSTNNNLTVSDENCGTEDVSSELQERSESVSHGEESLDQNSPEVTHNNPSETLPTDILVDSDKENCIPNSSTAGNSAKKMDNPRDKQTPSDTEGNESSAEPSFFDIRIESTTTITDDHFNGNISDTDLLAPQESCDVASQEGSGEVTTPISSEAVDTSARAECRQTEEAAEASEAMAPPADTSPEPTRAPSPPQVSESGLPLEPNRDSNCTPESFDLPPSRSSLSMDENRVDSLFSSQLAINIKEEPIDSPSEEEEASEMHCQIRVKSEFSTFDYEEDITDYETIDGGSEKDTSDVANLTNDPSNTECYICNRRYASVGNYMKHLRTKVHLNNAGMTEKVPDEVLEQDSPMLRSRLSAALLNAPFEEPTESSPLGLPTTSSPSKRKIMEHCDLCNTSFGYISELKRHLLSKKHKENAKIVKRTQSPPLPPPPKKILLSKNISPSDNRSIFICPIENCHFSCVKGVSLLSHMKIHGIDKPLEEQAPSKSKLSLRQQELFKKEAEKRKLAEQQQKLQLKQQYLQQQHQLQLQQQQSLQLQMQLNEDQVQENYSEDYRAGNSWEFECKGCHKTFIRESGLRKHGHYCSARGSVNPKEQTAKQEGNTDSKEGTEAEKLHCPLCDLSFASRKVFVNHVQIYHKGSNLESGLLRPYKKPVMQLGNKLRVSNKKGLGFVCNICGKKFNLLSSLNFHIKSHTVSVKHICRICKEGFNDRKAFMEHCRMHFLKPGSKETLCHKCFKVFKTRSELYYHRKNDMCSIKLKIYSCNLCQHSFKEPSALEEHRVMCHSESLDMTEDPEPSSSIGELYDDSFISASSIPLISSTNEALPGTSLSNYNIQNMPNSKSSINSSNKNPINLSNTVNSLDYSGVSSGKSPFHCEICDTDYATRATLRKHIKKFHILNIPYMGSRKYSNFQKGNILQANALKQWKCKHCKSAFGSRKILVLHLRKCQYNVLDLSKGMCYQCGKWCESGKTRICRFCLPDFTKHPPVQNNFVQDSKFQQPDYQSFQSYKPAKQEYIGHQEGPTQNFQNDQDSSSLQKQQMGISVDKPAATIKTDHKDVTKSSTSASKSNPANQKKSGTSVNNIELMKCPIGNKFFRNEMIMIKHYSQCDGKCENRCSHCRRLFNSPKEYKVHLVNSKCYGQRRTQSRMKYPSFGSKRKHTRSPIKQEISVNSMNNTANLYPESNTFNNVDKLPDDCSDITFDMSTAESNISETSSLPESSASTPANRILEEKSLKIGRVCTICDKVITMQRGIYRHVYSCFKMFMLSQESVSCKKCSKTFSKHQSLKDNTSAIRQHVLDCHFIPYYIGEGLAEDGTRLNTPPPFLCYVCSFGFNSNSSLQKHIKEHRYKKDEVNNMVLQLEEEMLTDERLADEKSMLCLYVEPKLAPVYTVKSGRTLSLQDSPPDLGIPKTKCYECDKCSRKFNNRNKFLRHKKVHGIVKQSLLNEVTANVIEFMNENASPVN